MTIEEAAAWLEANGWKEWAVQKWESGDRAFFKKFPGEPRCITNRPKPLQMRVKLYDHRKYGVHGVGIEVDITAQPNIDDTAEWVCLKAYSIQDIERLPSACETLLHAWRAISQDDATASV